MIVSAIDKIQISVDWFKRNALEPTKKVFTAVWEYGDNSERTSRSFLFDFSNGDFVVKDGKLAETDDIIAEVSAHIEESRPIGAAVTVKSAVPLIINISVSLPLANGVTTETATEKITEAVSSYLKKNTFAGTYISYAQIGGYILSVDEVFDYSNLKVNGATSNITVPETSVRVLG